MGPLRSVSCLLLYSSLLLCSSLLLPCRPPFLLANYLGFKPLLYTPSWYPQTILSPCRHFLLPSESCPFSVPPPDIGLTQAASPAARLLRLPVPPVGPGLGLLQKMFLPRSCSRVRCKGTGTWVRRWHSRRVLWLPSATPGIQPT